MSAFLIQPKTVLDKTVCCNASGVSEPVIANDISETSQWGNMAPFMIVPPDKWMLAGGLITGGYGKTGTLGFGVCCGTKEFMVAYEFYAGLSFIAADVDYVEIYLNASSNIHVTHSIVIVAIKNEDETYELSIIEQGSSTTTTVSSLEDITLTVSYILDVTATPCSGQAYFVGSVDVTNTATIPATVTAQFAISDLP